MFLFSLRKKVQEARKELEDRLEEIRMTLLQPELAGPLRKKLEEERLCLMTHLQTRIDKINGGP